MMLPIAGMTVLNQKVLIPAGKKTAQVITTSTGLLTKSEAQQQMDMFDDFIQPVNQFLGDMADDLLNIVTGGFYDIGMEFLGFKKEEVQLDPSAYNREDILIPSTRQPSTQTTQPTRQPSTQTTQPTQPKREYNPPSSYIAQRDVSQEQFMKLKQQANQSQQQKINPLLKS